MPVMIDLCSGFGGASEAMKQHGWRVIRMDNEPRVQPDVVGDLLALPFAPFPVDLMWISPPCTEYAREDMPWCRKGVEPDHTLYRAGRAIIAEWQPRFWIMENVRGAIRYWGQPTYSLGSYKLWTNLPLCPMGGRKLSPKAGLNATKGWFRSARRGMMPYELSDSVRSIVESLT